MAAKNSPKIIHYGLWFHPKIIITPHIAAAGIPKDMATDVTNIMIKFQQGLPLPNLVDVNQGY